VFLLQGGVPNVRLLYLSVSPSGPMGTGAAILFAHWSLEKMFVVALKRAGFAVSWGRTASWEIPTCLSHMGNIILPVPTQYLRQFL
jgi:hypothetical protein